MLSEFLPEAREKQELGAKEAAFRGMSQVRGVAVETTLSARIVHPGEVAGGRHDCASLELDLGVRRTRPRSHLEFGSGDFSHSEPGLLTLDRQRAKGPNDFLLPEYCSSPLPRFERQETQGDMCYAIVGGDIGLRSSVDLVTGEYRPRAIRCARENDGRRHAYFATVGSVPTKRYVSDVFLHRDVFAGLAPQLRIYDVVMRGLVTAFDDVERQRDRIWMHERITPIAGGMSNARWPGEPRYVEMLERVCGKLGWDPSAFRGFRLDVQYPVYGAVYMLGFELPEAPGREK
jgi:hypothetical protein